MAKFSNKILIAESNHDKHLDQNIEMYNFDGRIIDDIILELALAMVDGQDRSLRNTQNLTLKCRIAVP